MHGMPDAPRLVLTVNEAAALLSCSRSTVYRLCRDGMIRSVRLGAGQGGVRIPRTALEDFVNGGGVAA